MSVHDETWDRCQWCGRVNKDWHGEYHSSKGCLKHDNYHDWLKIIQQGGEIYTFMTSNEGDFVEMVMYYMGINQEHNPDIIVLRGEGAY